MFHCTRPGVLLLAAFFIGSLATTAIAASQNEIITVAAVKKSAKNKTTEQVASEKDKALASLEKAAKQQVQKVSKTLRPDIDHKNVTKNKNGAYIATYKAVDDKQFSFSLSDQSGASDQFVGNVIYVVHEYQCIGKTKKEALKAPCEKVKSQRVREMSRYSKGSWHM